MQDHEKSTTHPTSLLLIVAREMEKSKELKEQNTRGAGLACHCQLNYLRLLLGQILIAHWQISVAVQSLSQRAMMTSEYCILSILPITQPASPPLVVKAGPAVVPSCSLHSAVLRLCC